MATVQNKNETNVEFGLMDVWANYDIFCSGDVILGVRINDEIPDVTRTSSFQQR